MDDSSDDKELSTTAFFLCTRKGQFHYYLADSVVWRHRYSNHFVTCICVRVHLRCGGIFNDLYYIISAESEGEKNLKNQSTFAEVMDN